MIIIENRTVPCNPRSKNYAKGTVVNVSGAASMSTFVYTPTYDDIINALKNGKDYITIPTILEVYGDLYSLGEVSAFGAGSGGSSGGGLIQTVYGYSSLGSSFNNDTLTDTFNAYTINQLHTRLSQVEVGAAINVAVSGTGNAVTGVTKNGNVLEFTKGLTFSLASHTHDYIPLSQKGTANGVASLDANGLIISAQLPSYVDDVIEVSTYANLPVSGESGKIYVTTDTNITYRWTGTTYVEISKSLALGETSSTAYRGDLGAIAYAHSQIAGGTGVHVSSTERANWNLAYNNNHTHTNKSVLDGITSALISNWNLAYTNNHTHANKSLLDAFSQSDNDVLNHLSIVDGKLKVDIDFYSTGEVSAFGAGSGTSGSGLIQTVYGLSGLGGTYSDATLTDTFNAYTINSLHGRINILEAGSVLNFTTAGSGNAVTSVVKSGNAVTVTKGLTFSVDGHTHTFASITSKPTTLSGYGITDAYTTSSADNTFLKLSGGTMTGAIRMNNRSLILGDSFIDNQPDGSPWYGLSYIGTGNVVKLSGYYGISLTTGNNELVVPRGGNPTINGNTIWHSGNDGSGSGLDADLLDGKHIADIYSKMSAFTLASEISSADKVWVANSSVTDVPSMSYSALLHVGNDSSRKWQIWNARGTNKLYWRPEKNDMSDFDSVRTLIDDYNIGIFNAGSATKLQTARTIWGQLFNGEENVSGAISGATTGSFSGLLSSVDLTVTNTGTHRAVITQRSIGDVPTDFKIGSNNADKWSITCRDSSLSHSLGIYNYDRTAWDIFIAGSSGNVLIGATTDSGYKLDVNGTLRATGAVTLGSTLNVAGATTLSSTLGVSSTVTAPTFVGNLNGNASSATELIGQTPQLAASTESNNINIVNNSNSTLTSLGTNASITKALQFRWYNNYWQIGNIRGANTDSLGFGITYGNSTCCFRVTTTAAYFYNNVSSTGAISAARFYAGYDSNTSNSMSCSGWFRSNGTTGWINDTYGGGIHMKDSTYVRVFNNKSFWVDNNIVATGEITAFGASDIRLKSNIKPINSALGFLGKVKTYEFDWNEKAISLNPLKAKKGAGVIAQEMSLLDNNFVHSIYGDYLGVDYERFIPYLIGGVNELSKKMYDYGNRLDRAEKRVAELELEVKRLIA